MDVFETRRQNLARLLRERGAKTQLALRLNTTQGHITHLLKPPTAHSARQIREETARQIEEAMGLTLGALDQRTPGDGHQAEPPPSPDRLPAPAADPDLLEDSVRTVIAVAAESHAKMVADKTATVVRIVYDHARATGRVDQSFVVSLVKLMR